MKNHWVPSLVAAAALALAGCSEKEANAPEAAASVASSPELEKIVVKAPAPQAIAVTAARKDAKNGDNVVVEGSIKEFVDGAPVFTLADNSLKKCTPDECKTPWDYCCETPERVAANSATVKLVGADGKPLTGNLKGVNSLDSLVGVAVEGKAVKDDAGNLIVEATKVYVK